MQGVSHEKLDPLPSSFLPRGLKALGRSVHAMLYWLSALTLSHIPFVGLRGHGKFQLSGEGEVWEGEEREWVE
jgi:hypothetical protein